MLDTNNVLCTLEMEWLPSLRDFGSILLNNGYSVLFQPMYDIDGEIDKNTMLVTILDEVEV